MANQPYYPFRLANAFFKTLHFEREPAIVDEASVDVGVGLRVHTDKLPRRLQIDLKIESASTKPMSFLIELIGLFDQLEGHEESSEELLEGFINERALFMMFPFVQDVLRRTTVSMGMKPLDIPMPYRFEFRFDEAALHEEE